MDLHRKIKLIDSQNLWELPIPHLSCALEDIFILPPEFWKGPFRERVQTVADLAVASGMSADEVKRKLRWLIRLSQGVEIIDSQLTPLDIWLRVGTATDGAYQGVLHRDHITEFYKFYQYLLKFGRRVVVLSESGDKGYSCAMFLRTHGVDAVFLVLNPSASLHSLLV